MKLGYRHVSILAVLVFSLCISAPAFAQELVLVFSGSTHAMLYTCSCPIEKDGGVARRAALIKEIKKEHKNVLVVDCGDFFAGGILDEYSQGSELDKKRTGVNLKAMSLMGYDAAALGDNELNFGKDFLEQAVKEYKLPFISANLKGVNGVQPYVIKRSGDLRIAFIGMTSLSVQSKAGENNVLHPRKALEESLAKIEKEPVDLIVLLSNMQDDSDLKLIEEFPQISVLVRGQQGHDHAAAQTKSAALVLNAFWQGRKLGKAVLEIKNKRVVSSKVEDIRLSDKISGDKDVLAVLPRCFSERECSQPGMIGSCQNQGELNSSCLFTEARRVRLLVIMPDDCMVCDPKPLEDFLKKSFPGLEAGYMKYPSAESAQFIEKNGVTALPAYFLGKEAERENGFEQLRTFTRPYLDYYYLKPELTRMSYFIERKKDKGALDIFISLYDDSTEKLLKVIEEFSPRVHFLVVQDKGEFSAKNGAQEVEDDLRSVCIQKYYPDEFWGYMVCRAENPRTSWWQDCLGKAELKKVSDCARGEEGKKLLEENVELTRELKIMFGPTYLFENKEIFSSNGAPSKKELEKIIKR